MCAETDHNRKRFETKCGLFIVLDILIMAAMVVVLVVR